MVDHWIKIFKDHGIPAVATPAIRIIGPDDRVIGYPDLIIRDPNGGWAVFEFKTGNDPTFTPSQRAYLPALQVGGHVYTFDPRIHLLGLDVGVPFPPMTVIIVHAPGPGLKYEFYKLPDPTSEP